MKTLQLPDQLLASLTELGLLESEAKIYSALVLLEYADVSDLLEILDVSKPRIYTSLGTLEERGLIVQTSPRPAIYQAIAPNVALEMIVKNYADAKNKAIDQFKIAKKLELTGKTPPPLYHIFGEKSLEFKIQDMLENARESVYCLTTEKYLKYIEKLAKKDVGLKLMVKSEDSGLRDRLVKLFRRCDAQICMINGGQAAKMGSPGSVDSQQEATRAELIDMDALFVLIVDDAEALFVLPIKSDSVNSISSTNPAIIYMMRRALDKNLVAPDKT